MSTEIKGIRSNAKTSSNIKAMSEANDPDDATQPTQVIEASAQHDALIASVPNAAGVSIGKPVPK